MRIINMKNITHKIAATATTMIAGLRNRLDNERGDIVQTLIIIAISVILGGLVLTALLQGVENCTGSLDGDGSCFGINR